MKVSFNYSSDDDLVKAEVAERYTSEIEPYLRRGCDDYEANKKTDEYRCWSKEVLCAAKEVVGKTVESYDMKNVTELMLGFSFNSLHYHTTMQYLEFREKEINWTSRMRWNDPRLLYWAKTDLEQVGQKMLDAVFLHIENKKLQHLQLVFSHYNSSGTMDLMKVLCESMNRNYAKMQCKLAIVFDRLAEFMIDDANILNFDTRFELSMLYLLQPKVYEIMNIASETRNKTLCDRLMTMFQSLYDNALNKDGYLIRRHFGQFGSIYASMSRDCTETYQNDFEQLTCYLADTFARMDALQIALGKTYDDWSSRSQIMRAVVLVWLVLTPKGNFYVKTNSLQRVQVVKELLGIMYRRVLENDLSGLQEIANLVPNENQMGLTSSDECTPNFDKISGSMKCGFKIVMENIAMFLNQYNSKDRIRTKYLDLSVDYNGRLSQFKISSIKDTVENAGLQIRSSLEVFTGDIKKYIEASMGNQFTNYFGLVAAFDLDIAKADTVFITDKLNEFANTAAMLQQKLEYDSSELGEAGVTTRSVDTTFKWFKAIGTGLLSIITGDFGGLVDASDRVDTAAQDTRDLVENSIPETIGLATIKFAKISEGFQKNRVHLENTKKLVDKLEAEETSSSEFKKIQEDFVKSYRDYTPQVNEDQIAELEAAWDVVVQNLEIWMGKVETKEALIASGVLNFATGHLTKIKIAVPQLSQTLSNWFDYQFELMDSLTATMRAHTSMKAANGLTTGFQDLEQQLVKSEEAQLALQQMALSTYVISQYHLFLILSQYCDYVTYGNAGLESSQCAKALRTMNTNDIDEAISYRPPSCDNVDVHLKIPTNDSARSGSINLNQFNSGEPVAFKIPNFNWFEVNGEISSYDKDSALFVKRFEIYAITNDSYTLNKNLRVEVTPAGSAPIYPVSGQVKYELRPRSRTKYVFEYKEDHIGNCGSETNPYLVCSPGPKDICVQSRGKLSDDLFAYPSIYSPWIIQLDQKIGHAPRPAPETKLFLQAKLQLCRKRKDSSVTSIQGRKRSLKKLKKAKKHSRHVYKDSQISACPVGKYFNQETGLFAACVNSKPQRFGYYCEKEPFEETALKVLREMREALEWIEENKG